MGKWLVVTLLLIGTHFTASYLVPLDRPSQATFGGLLRWAWPWSEGDHGPLGTMTAGGFPMIGFYLAVTAAAALLMSALALAGLWVPVGWWRVLALVGAALSVCVLALFFGPTKVLPIALNFAIIAAATGRWAAVAAP